jgi:TRAP-type C4-dicarboxylate transport system permease small subunit
MKSNLFIGFERLLSALSTLFAIALGALVAAMCLDVVIRYVSTGSLSWVTELTEYIIYGGTFLAAPWVLRQGGHVRVDILLLHLPRRHAIALERMLDAIGMVLTLLLGWYGAIAVRDAWRDNMIQFKTWNTPEWLLLLPIPIGCALLAVEFALRALRVPGVVKETVDVLDRPSF